MRVHNRLIQLALLCAVAAPAAAREPAQSHEVVRIWPGQAPGTEDWKGSEEPADVTLPNVGKIHVITNVTVPTVTVFQPARGKANGTAMVVLPGGSFRRLPGMSTGSKRAVVGGQRHHGFRSQIQGPAALKGRIFRRVLEDFAGATKTRRAIAVADAVQAIRFIRSHSSQVCGGDEPRWDHRVFRGSNGNGRGGPREGPSRAPRLCHRDVWCGVDFGQCLLGVRRRCSSALRKTIRSCLPSTALRFSSDGRRRDCPPNSIFTKRAAMVLVFAATIYQSTPGPRPSAVVSLARLLADAAKKMSVAQVCFPVTADLGFEAPRLPC